MSIMRSMSPSSILGTVIVRLPFVRSYVNSIERVGADLYGSFFKQCI
jgi:hypothetical protein